MSLQSLLSIARSALNAHQRAMDVTAHNVANANTPGYSRQRLVLQSATPLQLPLYSVGRGVDAVAIERTRSRFYDDAYRRDSGLLGMATTMRDYLGQVETAMNEPSDNGLSASLDSLFAAFSDLAGDPANHTNRELVVSAANRLANQLHTLDAQVGRVNQESIDNLNVQVGDVNALASKIANLNQQILASGGAKNGSPDLMDQRDALVEQMSQFLNVRVLDRGDGTIGLVAGDTLLVDGAQATALAVAPAGAGFGIVTAAGGAAVDPQSGSMKALVDLMQTKLPAVRAQLDALAGALVAEFNSLHRAGTTLGGATGVDFFDPARTTAGTIDLSAALKASSDNLAASANGAQGNGDVAAQIAALATQGVPALGGKTFREHYVSLAAGIGLDVRSAGQDISAESALLDQSDQSRQALSGVNIDDEMISLVASQQAYQAAARLVSAADEMMRIILESF
jgi:flagellar hook-associated protein 1 FlgK